MNSNYVTKLVLQFLEEMGYTESKNTLLKESGNLEWEDLKFGGNLMSILNEHAELKLSMGEEDNLEIDDLLMEGDMIYSKVEKKSFNPHVKKSVVAIEFSKENKSDIFTGSADKTVIKYNIEEDKVLWKSEDFGGGILSLSHSPISHHLLASSMDSTCRIIDSSNGKFLQSFKDHNKYVVRCKWSDDGKYFATASYDKTVNLYGVKENGEFELKHNYQFLNVIEAICFTVDSKQLVCGIRDDNHLYYLNLETQQRSKYNMNANGDNHVSFFAMDVVCSEKYVLVTTNNDRTILFFLESEKQARNFYGQKNDIFSNPRSCWSLSEKYVYSTSHESICVFDVSSQKVVERIHAHKGTIRDMTRQVNSDLIATTCMTDNLVKLWAPN
eukprot:TRINITY_DN6792_c0_g1_i1.p1 TRINITY_DN6792_c0_g1~~TRINITY_DN6792_c0_g1_i1.p1  ORF type:complete len:384 (+),score=97.19 TRINITY_DN6792_c0_g1_i1:32-1183(+)